MSAFIVSHKHINTLVQYANANPLYMNRHFGETVIYWDNYEQLQSVAEILLAENVRSINARYPDTAENPENMPGPIAEVGKQITFNMTRASHLPDAVQIIKACNCYDYQACETDDYRSTLAAKIVDNIRAVAIANLPGYDKAEWSID